MSGPRLVRAPRGTKLTCKSWLTEAAYRMIQNNLDPEVAEMPGKLVVYVDVGMGYSQHAGQVIVADGTPEAAQQIRTRSYNGPRYGRGSKRKCGV